MKNIVHIDETELSKASALLADAVNVVVVSHTHPDGDALGSSLGLGRFLSRRGKKVTVIYPDKVSLNLSFIFTAEDRYLIFSQSPDECRRAIANADVLCCVDFNAPGRLDELGPVIENARAPKLLADHHLNPAMDCFDIVFSETEISSASELVFWLLMKHCGSDIRQFGKPSLHALLTGMTTDTNNFANSVYPSTFTMASLMLEAGINRDRIVAKIYNNYPESRFRSMGYMLADKLRILPGGIAYYILTEKEQKSLKINNGDTEGFVNMALGIKKVKMSIALREENGVYRVSIRSKKGWSANRLARDRFNGGGHELAAGGKLRIPEDVADENSAAAYIEKATADAAAKYGPESR